MTLSLKKLETLLSSYGFVCNNYFIQDRRCMYIELMSITTADTFIMYIPSNYTFEVKNRPNTYKLQDMDLDTDDNIADNYGEEVDNIQDKYNEVSVDLILNKDGTIEKELENKYKRQIKLKEISNNDIKDIKSIYRQLRRLRYCVQEIEYKTAILFKNYLCIIRRDDTIDIFIIRGYNTDNKRKLFIVCDLERFYEKPEKIEHDIKTVRSGLYKILSKNQSNQFNVMTSLFEDKNNIGQIIIQSKIQITKFNEYIMHLNDMIFTMNNSEKVCMKTIRDIKNNTIMYRDTEKNYRLTQLSRELEKIGKIKKALASHGASHYRNDVL